MEEEKNPEVAQETVQETKENTEKSVKKFDFKKYCPIIGGAVAVIVILALVLSSLIGSPKKAVKKYVSALNSKNAKKITKCVDYAGVKAWGWKYSTSDFDKDDYKEFVEAYKDVDKDDIKDYKESAEEYMEDAMDELKDEYKSFKATVKEFKSVKKLGKDLYLVKARIHLKAVPKDKDEDTIDESETTTFVVYKNKLITTGSIF